MSRGLGTAQQLVLDALASLEAENGEGGRFYVWAVVDRAFALSSRMQSREAERQAAIQANTAAIRERAAQGDDRAALYLRLTYGQIPCRPRPRQRRSAPFRVMEVGFNPSRVLASLERRGLVSREAVKGGGAAGLTDDGRRLAAQISVGTTLPLDGDAHG